MAGGALGGFFVHAPVLFLEGFIQARDLIGLFATQPAALNGQRQDGGAEQGRAKRGGRKAEIVQFRGQELPRWA